MRASSRDHVFAYCLRRRVAPSQSKTRLELQRAASKLSHGLKNRPRNLVLSRKNSKFSFGAKFEKEIIAEIQFTDIADSVRSGYQTARQAELLKPIEVVDRIRETKVHRAVKFQENSSTIRTSRPKEFSKLASQMKASVRTNLSKKKGLGSRNVKTKTYVRAVKYDTILRSRNAGPQEGSWRTFKDRKTSDNSRPSSVSSIFTACTANINMVQQKVSGNHDNFHHLNRCGRVSREMKEIIKEVNESINSS